MVADDVKRALVESIHELIDRDAYLLEHDVNERAITHKLAIYLQRRCAGFDVDCEYNRNMREPKRLDLLLEHLPLGDRTIDVADVHAVTVYPDVIVHQRGSNEENLLVIEMKKAGRRLPNFDKAKLRGFCQAPYHYRNAALVTVGWNGGPTATVAWAVQGGDAHEREFVEAGLA